MKSIGFLLKLRPGAYEEYKRRHATIWPEMATALHSCGISMVIFRHEDTLFVHQRAPSQESFDKMAAHPITPRWDQYMNEVLVSDASGSRICIPMSLIFSFGEFSTPST